MKKSKLISSNGLTIFITRGLVTIHGRKIMRWEGEEMGGGGDGRRRRWEEEDNVSYTTRCLCLGTVFISLARNVLSETSPGRRHSSSSTANMPL